MNACGICGGKYHAKGLCRYHYTNSSEVKERNKKTRKEREQKPEFKEKHRLDAREYYYNPGIKERMIEQHKEYRQTPEAKKVIRKNKQRPEVKQKEKEHRDIPEVKEARKKSRKINEQIHSVKKAIKKYQKEYNKGYNKGYLKNRILNDSSFATLRRLRGALRQAFTRYSKTGKITTSRQYGINYKAIIEQLKPFPENIKDYHIDHIIPLSSFDFNDAEQIKKAFAPENHQWLLAEENLKKGSKIITLTN